MRNESGQRDWGRAAAGDYFPPLSLLNYSATHEAPQSPPTLAFEVADYQHFIKPDEQKFYDWCVGMLEDSDVVGRLQNERVYLDEAFQGELQVGATCYRLDLSRTSVSFDGEESSPTPLLFSDSGFETDGDLIEASRVGKVFASIREQSILNRIWASCTSLVSSPAAGIKDFRLGLGRSVATAEIETSLGECTLHIRRGPRTESLLYSLFDTTRAVHHTPRVADALLEDIAEDLGGEPEVHVLLDAMVRTAQRASMDLEWLSVGAALRLPNDLARG